MKPEDVRMLLEDASQHVAEPDLADRVWADGLTVSRRRRRVGGAVSAVAVLALVVTAAVAGPRVTRGTDVAPSPDPLPSATNTVPRTGEIDGVPFWLGPEAGSEAWLDRVDTVFADRLEIPDGTLDDLRQRPIRQVAAVMLRKVPGADRYRPVLMSVSGRWAEAGIDLVPTKDPGGNAALPLDTSAVSPNGAQVAFAQPNQVVILDTQTADVERIPVPSATIENVSWMQTGDRVLAAGNGVAFKVLVGAGPGEQVVEAVDASPDPWAMTSPLALDSDGSGEVLYGYGLDGRRRLDQRTQLPVDYWYGSTAVAGSLAARGFGPGPLTQLTAHQAAYAIAVVESHPDAPAKMLMLPDGFKTVRTKGCCSVLGWYDDHTVLFESRVSGSSWILGWNVLTGQVLKVTGLGESPVALGPKLVR